MPEPMIDETRTLAGGRDVVFEVRVEVGPDSYGAWMGSETSSATLIDVTAAVEEDMRRFRRAWDELAHV